MIKSDTYLIFDIDGTISGRSQLVYEETVATIVRLCREYKLLLGFCTGRGIALFQYLLDNLYSKGVTPDILICEEGSQVYSSSITAITYFSQQVKETLIQDFQPQGVSLFYVPDKHSYYLYGESQRRVDTFLTRFQNIYVFKTTIIPQIFKEWMRTKSFGCYRTSNTVRKYGGVRVFFNPKHKLYQMLPNDVSKSLAIHKYMKNGCVLYCGNEPADEECYEIHNVTSFHVGNFGGQNADYRVSCSAELLDKLEWYLQSYL